jgi:S-adenosylmethionine synthetase
MIGEASSMGEKTRLFTSESVTEGHPDKVADQISDAILDAIYERDPDGRVAVETLVTSDISEHPPKGVVVIAGEITTTATIDIPEIARRVIQDIGYTEESDGFCHSTVRIVTYIRQQSPDISLGVTARDDHEQGAGDQGMMFGYATDETAELMPLPIVLAHKLTRRLAEVRKNGTLPFLRPDGKAQVTVEYVGRKPRRVVNVLVSSHHTPDVKDMKVLEKALTEHVILKVVPKELLDERTEPFLVNPTGRFEIGGPRADSGVTGRKIIVDSYGGKGGHGGGCFSGKDPTKVDRSGAYMARHVAKNVVAAELAKECEVQIAYAIGKARPVSVLVDTFGTGVVDEKELSRIVREVFDLRPAQIIDHLLLKRPIYRKTAAYGHFGRENDPDFTWELRDHVEMLRKLAQV